MAIWGKCANKCSFLLRKSISSVIGKEGRGEGKERGDPFGQLVQSKILKDTTRFLYARIYDFYPLWRNSQVKEKGRGDVYLPPIPIYSVNYSHTASWSCCSSATVKLELCGLCLPSYSWQLAHGSRWSPGIAFKLLLFFTGLWSPARAARDVPFLLFCSSYLLDTLEIICHLWFVPAMRNRAKPEGSQPEVGGLGNPL